MKPDTTEARRLADALASDVAVLLREGLPQEAMRADAAQSAIRALADEHDSLRAQVEALRADAERMDWLETTAALMVSANHYAMREWLIKRPAGLGNLRASIDAARSQEAAG